MCGIVGVLSSDPIDPAIVTRMRDALVHRGPDAEGLWLSTDQSVCLGHRRLAIVDLSADANQPWIASDGRFVVVYNGEIYNFRELRRELEQHGVAFRTRSDTEVLVESYRAWGDECLTRLSGMFAFAIWDAENRRLFCARDRAGEKPFYYAVQGDTFLFASELKAFEPWPGLRRKIDYTSLADYLTLGFVPDPKSIWQGVRKLPPAHRMGVRVAADRRLTIGPTTAWWDFTINPDTSVSDWGPRIRETLQHAASEMTVADVPVGAFLSGGVDSSSVTAALSRSGATVKTFTIGFEEPGYDERPWAREVATLLRTPHTERAVRAEDADQVFERLVWHFDEPFNDYSYVPTYYVCREARKEITVALTGDGGDEAFAGYGKYQRLALRHQWGWAIPRTLFRNGSRLFPRGSRNARTLEQYAAGEGEMLVDSFVLGFQPRDLRRAARGELARVLRDYCPTDVVRSVMAVAPPEEIGLVNAMRYLDLKLTLAGDILVKVDRASMAVSLEVRPVYLHRDVLALAAAIPPSLLASRTNAKRVLKSALEPWLPASILYRRKQGFAMPLGAWLRAQQVSVGDERGATSIPDVLDSALLADLQRTHGEGREDATARIHSLLFLDRWARRWAA